MTGQKTDILTGEEMSTGEGKSPEHSSVARGDCTQIFREVTAQHGPVGAYDDKME